MLARHVDVGDIPVFAHDRQVRDDVDGGDVPSDDAKALLALAQRLHHLLHSAAHHLGAGGLLHELVHLLGGLLGRQGLGDHGDELNLQTEECE